MGFIDETISKCAKMFKGEKVDGEIHIPIDEMIEYVKGATVDPYERYEIITYAFAQIGEEYIKDML